MRSAQALIFKLLTLLVGFPLSAQVVSPDDSISVATTDTSALPGDTLSLNTDTVPQSGSQALKDKVNYDAQDSISYDVQRGTAYLYNKAHVDYGDIQLDAGYIAINFESGVVTASGIVDSTGNISQKPIFTEKGKQYASDTIRYNFNSRRARIQTITTQEGEGYIHGSRVKMVDQKTFYIENVRFTTCNLQHPHFDIIANKAKIVAGEKVVTGPAFLRIADVTTPLFVPFGFFPMQERRASGIIIPSYTDQLDRGFGLLGGGYYWAVNDYMDLIFTGDIYTKGTYALNLASNYNVRYRFQGNLSAGFSRLRTGDPRYAEAGQFSETRDFRFRWTHRQDAKARPDLRLNADVNFATSSYYRNNSRNPEDVLQNSFRSSVNLAKTWQGTPFTLNAAIRHQQNNGQQTFSADLPEVAFAMNRIQPFERDGVGEERWYERIGLVYNLDSKLEIRDSLLAYEDPSRLLENNRMQYGANNRIGLTWNTKIFKFATLTPSISYGAALLPQRYTYSWDTVNNRVDTDTIAGFNLLQRGSISASATTKLYGLFNFDGRFSALRHIITPRVGFSYTPDFTTDYWNYYETVQVDTLGNTEDRFVYQGLLYAQTPGQGGGSITFDLQNNFDGKWRTNNDSVGETKFKILERLNFSTAYNLAADKFNWQPIQVAANNTFFNGKFGVNYQGTFDVYGIDSAGTRVNVSALEQNGKLLRNTQNTFSFDLRLNGGKRGPTAQSTGPMGLMANSPNYYQIYDYMNVTALWTLNFSYSYQTRVVALETNTTQTLNVTGSLEPTPNWRLGFSTGYDLVNGGLTYTTIDLKRDLHCWELSVQWVPFGTLRSYTFAIRAKASMFNDLKYEQARRQGQL
ncbi:MAG: LPS-assembly protein LptD [Flavobacteriia bacterium]|nr:LPS-assembly protein LptD [Flavobacteriia bacterium]